MIKNYFRYALVLPLVCGLFVTQGTGKDSGKKIAAFVNDTGITEQRVQTAIQNRLPQTAYHQQLSDDRVKEIRGQALQDLIEEELLYQEARRTKLKISVLQIEQQLSEMKQRYESDGQFQKALKQSGLNSLTLMASIERRLLVKEMVRKQVTSGIAMSDQDVADYYEENKTKFTIPEQFHLSQILISVVPGAMADGWQAGQDSARKVVIHLKNGKDFAQMAKNVSADTTTRDKGGDLGWFHKGHLVPELQEAVEKTPVGEITEPVRSIYGFHIFRIEGTRPPRVMPLEEINLEELRSTLTKRSVEKRRKEFIGALRKQATIEIRVQDNNTD